MVTGKSNTEDLTFAKSRASRCHLALNIYPNSLKLGITDIQSKQHVYFNEVNINSWKNDFAPFFQYEFENVVFKKASALLFSDKNLFVPSGIYSEANEKKFFELEFGTARNASLKADHIPTLGSYNIYLNRTAVEKILTDVVKNLWIKHHQSALTELMARESKLSKSHKVFVNIREDHFDLLIFDKEKMIFCNQFAYRTPEDLIYFFLMNFEELGIDLRDTPVYLLGTIEKNDDLYSLMHAYTSNIYFLKGNDHYSHNLNDDVPIHREYLLYHQMLCA